MVRRGRPCGWWWRLLSWAWRRPTSGLEAYSKRKGGMTMRWNGRFGLALVVLAAGLMGVAVSSQAVTFDLASCHSSTGCPAPGTVFGTVTLTQVGSDVTFDVSLNNGNKFIQTGSGAEELFLFNGAGSGSTI